MSKEVIAPVRVQRSRQHKNISPNGLPIVYVGRPSKWGNEWRPKEGLITIEDCIKLHKRTILAWKKKYRDELKNELRGKNLSCWCKIGSPCHADFLLKFANQ